ncbi:MAG: hypothetical protein V4726_08390 [Verrucomicrobiota bacterium]
MRPGLTFFSWAAMLPLFPLSAGAVNIVIDYTYDTASLFNATAKATLAKAAGDLTAALGGTPLAALGTNSFTGSSGSSSATVNWGLTFTSPADGTTVNLSTPQTAPGFAANEIRIYAGWRNLTGSVLGTAIPGSASVSGGSSSSSPAELTAAISSMVSLSNATMGRGDGPVINQFSGSFGSPDSAFTVNYGSFVGSLWFDSDTNNDSITDTAGTLATAWNLGLDQPSGGQFDLYSTALHEMMHAIGFGSSTTWNSLSDPRIAADHLAAGTTGARLSDGVAQEAVMTPTTVLGTRKELTAVDVEFLGKLGYNVVPEPAAGGFLALTGSLLLMRRRRRRRC